MHKRTIKIGTHIIFAGFLLIGGTFAFFTSSDQINNIFSTGSNSRTFTSGLHVVEDFRSQTRNEEYDDNQAFLKEIDSNPKKTEYGKVNEGPTNVLPGEEFIKKVRVDNEANYYQYIRVKVIIDWDDEFITTLENQKQITKQEAIQYANEQLEIFFPDKGKKLTEQNWLGKERYNFTYTDTYDLEGNMLTYVSTTGYLYYKVAVAPTSSTEDILQNVKLKNTAGNEFKNSNFDIIIDAEAIQATEKSWYDLWKTDLPPIQTPPVKP
ncbi:MAG: SipW-dependent-type signal peptide-containing protein [Culicoidibacterales bacterium]